MKEQLIQYVELLFAGAPDAQEVKQEILQNTLDRYDDLIEQGKSPEASYRLAISGIGDINEILSGTRDIGFTVSMEQDAPSAQNRDTIAKKIMRAVAIALYIICPVPLFVLGNTLGLCGLLAIVAVATCLIILGKKSPEKEGGKSEREYLSPQQELRKSISSVIWAIGLAVYFIISFSTGAWYITWIIFPIIASVQGLVNACIDLKEADHREN